MINKIKVDPKDEQTLVDTRDLIQKSEMLMNEQQATLDEVYRHYGMLEDFQYNVKQDDIESYWDQKMFPLEVKEALADSKMNIQKREVELMTKLDSEKEAFIRSLDQYRHDLEKIKKFSSLAHTRVFAQDSFTLKDNLTQAFNTVHEFNRREGLFNQPKIDYPELIAMDQEFTPFHELLSIASDKENYFADWKT